MLKQYLIAALFCLTACASTQANSSITVLNYDDFGPQVIAHELIGMDWWQWQSHGDSRPRKYDIKVIVYRNVSLDTIKEKYPVIPEKQQDYRYLEYNKAIEYLDKHIEENAFPALTQKLKSTRKKLL